MKEDKDNFRKLKVWQKAHKLVIAVYKITKAFPKEEKFRLVDQLCRSASSIPANIVEGNTRRSGKEYLQFLSLAKASLEETKYHLLLAKDLDYLTTKDYRNLIEKCNEVGKMLSGLIKAIKAKL